ncbi:MAG: HTTM domain-containing protein [Aeromicrobium sp.]
MINQAWDWLTADKRSTYGLAVTRMILGFIVASQLIVNWLDRHYTWGDGAAWTETVRDSKEWPAFLGLFKQSDGLWFDLAYLVTIVFGLLLMVGLYTRASAVMTLFMWLSLYVSNPFVGSGGDAVLRMVLFYLCFTDAGKRWSVDARLRSARGGVRPLMPEWFTATLHNLAVILIIHQVVMVYVGSAFWKVQSEVWRNGTAVYFPLQTDAYSPWNDWLHPVFSSAPIIAGATYTAIVVQLFFPVLLIYRPTRMVALLMITGMHLGIGVFMGILYFSLVMIAVDMILVSDRSWLRGLEWLQNQRIRINDARSMQKM